jgi:hypothetical protein
MPTINRSGKVSFHDASLHVWEEPGGQVRPEWEARFKKEVFLRIVQQLNRLGWACSVPQDMITQYSRAFAQMHRYCRKGDLQAELSVSGRHIELKMWQDVANITHRSGGKYEFDKEQKMPYLLRLEMERTRRRIRDYLCGVFDGYEFDAGKRDGRSNKRGFMHRTALEWLQGCYATSGHFKGDLASYQISPYNSESADKTPLQHGQRVWFYDRKGRLNVGTAHYNINNMWWVVTGRYDVTNEASFHLHTSCPGNVRVKRNADIRRKRLEGELSKAVLAMNYERAATLRDLLFPKDAQLFMVFHEDHDAYHGPSFRSYTKDTTLAGKFTAAEVAGWNQAPNRVVALPQ